VREAFALELPIRALFEAPTVEQLAGRLRDLRGARLPLQALPRPERLPLSYAQQRLWFIHRLEGPGSNYNIPIALRLTGHLDADALDSALLDLLTRHEALRTRFPEFDGVAAQQIVPVVELNSLLTRCPVTEAELAVQLQQAADTALDITVDLPFRAWLFSLANEEQVLLMLVHHIAADGASMAVLADDLTRAYSSRCLNQAPAWPDLPIQYADYALWQRQSLGAVDDPKSPMAQQLAFWQQALRGLPDELNLPTDRPRPLVSSYRGGALPIHLSAELHRDLLALAQAEQASLFMLLQATLAALLSRLGAGEDIAIGAPIAGRTDQAIEGLIGFFVNALVLRTDLSGRPSLRTVLQRVRTFDLDAYAHQDLPFELLVDALQPTRSMARHPLFQVMLALQNTARPRMDLPELTVAMEPLARTGAKFDLLVSLAEQYDADGEPLGLWGELEFSSDLFDADTVEHLSRRWLSLIEQAVAEPDAPLYQCALLTPEERHALLEGFNATTRPVPDATLPALFEAQAARDPAATALVFADRELSYGELNARANQLAHALIAQGAGPESLIGLYLDRSFELVISLLAVLKSGAAYLPLDPEHPAARIAAMLDDATPLRVITTAALADNLPADCPSMVLDDPDMSADLAQRPQSDPSDADRLAPLTPLHPAYVIFTSGSTGKPKGVLIAHHALVNHMRWMQHAYPVAPQDRVLGRTAPTFDASVWELWLPLLSGAAQVLISTQQLHDAQLLFEQLDRQQVHVAQFVPSLLASFLSEYDLKPQALRQVFSGGEALSTELTRRLTEQWQVEVVNLYGPTETTIQVTHYAAQGNALNGATTPIGAPIWNTRIYLLDQALEPVPVGVAGELYIAGAGLARGYLNRPALTAERFVADPFSPTPGARMYRTGDLARWRDDGNLEFLGRADSQVKIRGFRIEPGEIEAVLLALPGVAQAAVIARDDGLGLQLVAYWVPSVATDASAETLRSALAAQVPDYMLPSAFVALDALPLTPNGKLDRRALPAPERGGAVFVPPSSPEESLLAALFGEVLGLERVSVDDSFFALGGHSLLATRLVSRVREAFALELPIRALFEAPTVEQLAGRLRDLRSARLPLQALPRPERLPLSYAQQRLWFIHRLEGPGSNYNIPIALRLTGHLDADALDSALLDLLARHEALRTRFPEFDGVAAQEIVPVADIGSLLTRCRVTEAELAVQLQQAADTALDITVDLPFRAWLFSLPCKQQPCPPRPLGEGRGEGQEQVLLMLVHHIAADGASMAVLADDLTLAYSSRCLNQAPAWPDLTIQYADYALWQRQSLGAVDNPKSPMAQQLAFWQQALRGLPDELNLPTDRPRPLVSSYRGGALPIHLSAELHRGLLELAQTEQASLFMLLQATLAALLSRLGAGEDIAIGAPIAGRTDQAIEGLIGFFVNALVLRTDLSGRPSLRTVLQRVRAFDLDAYAHQDLPFELLVDALQPTRSMARHPLFQVMLALQNTARPRMDLPGLTVAMEPLARSGAKFDLLISLAEQYDADGEPLGLWGELEFSSDLFDTSTIELLIQRWLRLIEQAVAEPDAPLYQCTLLTPEERHALLEGFNATTQPIPDATLPALFEAQAARDPAATALIFADQELSYGELNARANRLAHALIAQGAGPESLIGLYLDRSFELVVSLLAVLKSGAAYLPLDPEHPTARIEAMLDDATPLRVITTAALADNLPADCPRIVLDELTDLAQRPQSNPSDADRLAPLTPLHPAYVIFTSGSTGKPKGVLIAHHALVNHMRWMQHTYPVAPQDRVLGRTAPTFDASVWELWLPLLSGAAQVLISTQQLHDAQLLFEQLDRQQVHVAQFVPSLLASFLSEYVLKPQALRQVFSGGEALSTELTRRLTEQWQVEVVNLYGPTETTIQVTHYAAQDNALNGSTTPIGAPIWNTRIYLLDQALEPVPVGVAGELYIAGAGLARGYLNRPALTAERFVADPFSPLVGARMYRSGDLARWREDGNLEFLGRADSQVKIRGFRIEPGEIEAVLLALPGVAQAAVIARDDGLGLQLVAYWVPSVATDASAETLRSALAAQLPDYMLPSAFVALDALPLTPNGKLDRRALPAPERGGAVFVPPSSQEETLLTALFGEVLGLGRVSVTDSFFALGGDSILSIQLVSRARRAGLEIRPRDIFERPTVAGLASIARPVTSNKPLALFEASGPFTPTPIMARFLAVEGPTKGFYQAMMIQLPAQIEADQLNAILQATIDQHALLRATFIRNEDGLWQGIVPPPGTVNAGTRIQRIDLRAMDSAQRELCLHETVKQAAEQLDPADGYLFEALWFSLPEGERLLWVIHHLAVDGVSWRILLSDLAAAWQAVAAQQAIALEPVATPFRIWAQRLHEQALSPTVAAELPAWESILARGVPLLPGVALDSHRDTTATSRTLSVSLKPALTLALLTEIPAAFHAQINDVLLTALAVAVAAWQPATRPGVLIDLEGHGREPFADDLDLSRTVGWFTTLYPVALSLEGIDIDAALRGEAAMGLALKQIKEQLRAIPDRGLGFGLLRYLEPSAEQRLASLPTPQLAFNYLGRFAAGDRQDWTIAADGNGLSGGADADMPITHALTVNAVTVDGPEGATLSAHWSWATRHLDESAVATLAEHWQQALSALVAHSMQAGAGGHSPADFPLLTLSQKQVDELERRYPNLETLWPLSPLQEGLLFHALFDDASPDLYTVQTAIDLSGNLEPERLRNACAALLKRHAVLRTGFVHQGQTPLQVVVPQPPLPWQWLDLSDLETMQQSQRAQAAAAELRTTRFAIDKPPLIRFTVLKLGQQQHRLLVTNHHLVLDGWSTPILLRELFTLYNDFGSKNTLAPVSGYGDYLAWLQAQHKPQAHAAWQAYLAGLDAPSLIAPDRSSQATIQAPHHWRYSFPETLSQGMNDFARNHGITLNTLFQGAWALLLSRLTGQRDVTFGITVSGRPAELPGVEQMVGLLINTLPLRISLPSDQPLAAWLGALQTRQAGLLDYGYLGLTEIQHIAGGLNPLFDTLLVFENYPIDRAAIKQGIGDLKVTHIAGHDATHYPLSLMVAPGEQLELRLEFDPALFDDEKGQQLGQRLVRLIEQAIAQPDAPLYRCDMLTPEERHTLLEGFNATAQPIAAATLPELFEMQAARDPAATALIFAGQELSYAELNSRANRLAHALIAQGAGPESLIGLCLERSFELIISLLAVLKSGAAYVPLDPEYPKARLQAMLEDAAPLLVISSTEMAAILPEGCARLLLDDPSVQAGLAINPESNPSNADRLTPLSPLHPAYVIFTSGSTGRPKGVMMSQQALVNLLEWQTGNTVLGGKLRTLQFTSANFDVSFQEIFGAWKTGSTLVLVHDEVRREPEQLVDLLRSHAIERLFIPIAALNNIAELYANRTLSPLQLKEVICAGEQLKVTPALRRFFARIDHSQLHNHYGPSESHVVTAYPLAQESKHWQEMPPIGAPIRNTRIYLLDQALEPVPVGVAGELYIAGAGLARGYLNRPALTAERFVADPFSPTPGARMYRSGDLARWRDDGNLEFLGRADSQVKIRGFRIEPGEIEAMLLALPGVAQAAVIARDDGLGLQLVAYWVPSALSDASAETLRPALAAQLPDYMLPSAFVLLDALPLTPNGKLDRRALPAPERGGSVLVPPSSPEEILLAALFGEVLGLERVSVDDSFFALGGHSLLATRLVSRVREAFALELPIRALFEAPTVAQLAGRLRNLRGARLPLQALPRPERLPLSYAQQRLWFIHRLEGPGSNYNIPIALRLTGPLDADALDSALLDLLARHEALRTRFPEFDGVAAQEIVPIAGIGSLLTRCQVTEAELAVQLQQAADTALDITVDLPFRAWLFSLPCKQHTCPPHLLGEGRGEEQVLLMLVHHIAADGASMAVLADDLTRAYQARCLNQAPAWPDLPIQYADYALWQRQALGAVDDPNSPMAQQLAFWQQALRGLPDELNLPTDRPRPLVSSYRGGALPIHLSAELHRDLLELAQAEQASLFMLLQATLAALLSRLGAGEDIAIGAPIAGRTDQAIEGLIGFFVNALVLRTDLSGRPSLRTVLQRVRAFDLDAYAHQDLPFELLVDALQPTRSMARHPLFQVMLALQNTARPRMDLPGLTVAMEPLARTGAKFDLLVSLAEQYDADGEPLGLWGELEFSSDLFDASTIELLIQRWLRLIEQAVAESDAPLYQCALLTPEERHALLEGFNATTRPVPDATLPALFEAQVASNPAATALVFGDRELSYGELNAQANRLAHHLKTLGVGPNTLVGICVERSFEMLVGVMAILKAGGAYMPLDPEYPQERLRFMLDDAAVPVLLTQQRLLAALPSNNAHVLCLDRDLLLFADGNRSTPPSRAQADDLAYLIYTSGSTGQPKGVAVTHRNVVRLVRSDDSLNFDSDEVFLQLAPLAFDASTLELWAALLNGGRLVLMPPGQSTLEDIGRHLTRHRVTTLWLTAGLFHLMVDERLEDLTGVRRLFAGGEALSVPHVQKAAAALGANRVINGYGPTENTTFTSFYPVPAADAIATSVPIGKPIANTRTYILDDALQPVPVGVTGELYTGGLGLARAYLNRPALTAERFVADPFSPTPGSRMYRTGDLARWREDGNLEFIGRADGQVKIRGFRIEPGEIETALLAVSEVMQAAVVARDDGLGLQLVAYWVPSEGSDTSAEALRLALSDQLPDYMLPSAFVALAALPLTANSKLDRRALPAPERGGYAFVSPSSPEEAPLAALFAEVLGLDQVSVADSFFALGGHSLLATRLVSRVREVMKVELPIRALFEAPTVAQLALRLRDLRSARLPLTALPRPERLPLSYAQQRLWFIHRMEGPSATYNIPIALRLTGPLNADALERALLDLLTRHEALRTRFPEFEGVAAQQIVPVADIGSLLTRCELSEAELTARLQQAADTALDISVELPFRAWLFCLGNEEQVLLILVHHIAADGSSMAALSDDLTLAYNARCLNQAPAWPNLPLQYADYALWQRQALGMVNDPLSSMAQQLAFWQQALRGLPYELNLPTDRPRPLVSSYRGGALPIHLSAELHRDLLALAQTEQASLFMLLQATLAALLSRLGAGEDIAIGAPIAGRTDKAIEGLIGFFVNTLVLRTDLSGRPSLRTVLQRVRTFDLDAYDHQDLPFELLVDALQPTRSMARHPLFQVILVLQNTVNARLDLPGISAAVEPLVRTSAKFDLSVNLAEFYGDNGEPLGLSGELEFSRDLFDAETVESLSRRWLSLIEQAVTQPDAPLHQCGILLPEERSMLLNAQTYVLDNALQPVPVGVVGELYTGDIGYARAYLTNPVLCAERFVADPFSPIPGTRMYRTGDWVRWSKDGNLEFIGRADASVKVRDFMPVEAAEPKIDFAPSRTPTESALADIWSEVLHLQQVDRQDNFFELGGHSLLATQVVSRIQRSLGIVMPFRALFENPSLGALAGYLDRQRQTETNDSMPLGVAPPILPVSRDQPLPLSFAQQRLWFIDQIGGGAAYNMSSALRLRGQLNVSALEQSLTEVVRRHESLRTTFDNSAEHPYQHIRAPQPVALPVTDLSHLPDALRRTETRREARQEAQKLFDLSRDLMLRARLLRLDEDEHVLLLSLHHIAADGWSNDVLVRELAELYEAFATDKPSALAELLVQYADFAIWQRQWLQGEVLQQQAAFWKKQLQGAPALLALPTDRPRPPVESFRGGVYPVQLDAKRTAGLRKLSRDADTTLFTTLLAAFQVLLARYSGQDDIVVGSPIANRNCLETEPLIGFFVNTLALRADLSGNPSFSQVLAQVKQTTLLAQDHQDLPFERLVEELQVERNLSYNPIVQIVFALQAAKTAGFALPGLEVSSFEFAEPSVRMDLELHLWEQAEDIIGGCSYAADLFDETTIARLMTHFYTLLDGIIADPERPILGLALLDESESRQILVDWNRTSADLPKDLCLHQLFEQQAARTPDQVAVVFAGQSLSYRQLDQHANQLAHHLQSLGVVPDSLVGICVERSADMVVGILAIHKAGGAYLPLDPAYPPERLAYMLEDAAAPVLLTQAALLDRLPAHNAKPVYLDSDWPVIDALPTALPSSAVTADNMAYVIYTSGSTGNPKGVLVEHRGVCSIIQAQIALLEIGADDRILQFASLSFDAAASEIMIALGSGAALYLGTRETLAPGEPLRRFLTDNAISLATVTPSTLAALPEDSLPALRTLGVAGEACSAELFGQWAKNRRFFNLYGPTEASICATAWRCETITANTPPIGRPLANVQVYILDALHQPVPIGVAGELYIGGVGVARGYLNRPELTEEKFIANPFGAGRLYKTGDLTRWLPDGNIEYLGRIDQQVKIRGFRIEPGEIESVLAQHPAVREAVVLARADQFGKPRLVAYLLTDNQESPTGALREWLQGKLPDYMVPAAFVRLETWPLTPNGKLDRQGLPEPEIQANDSEYLAPQTLTESALAEVWRKVLNVERVGRQDNFFELGGHSLLLTQLIYHIEAALGVLPAMRDLFRVPTLSAQAAHLDACMQAQGQDAVPIQSVDFAAESQLDPAIWPPTADFSRTAEDLHAVLITGASGFLGAYLLDELARQTSAELYCLVRADNTEHGIQRLRLNLERHGLWRDDLALRLHPVVGDLEQPRLGLSVAEFDSLAERIDAIYHSGAHDNFLYPYAMLKAANVDGTHELLRLAALVRTKPLHFVSTLSVVSPMVEQVRETDPLACPEQAGMGYVDTKWVAEQLVQRAAERGMPVTVHRPTHILGVSDRGYTHIDDAWYRRLLNDIQLGAATGDDNADDNLVPVGFVSRAIVHLSLQQASLGKVFHLSNPSYTPRSIYQDVLRERGYSITLLPFGQWLAQLVEAAKTRPDLGLIPLLPMLTAYDTENPAPSVSRHIHYVNTTAGLADSGIVCPEIGHAELRAYFAYLIDEGHFPPPQRPAIKSTD